MHRRSFVTLLGGVAAWPLAAHAQSTVPVVGFIFPGGPEEHFLAAFRLGLGETGYVEGRNVVIEYRFAEGHNDRLAELAADLVRRKVAVIAATGGTPAALAAKAASSTIPTVFVTGEDPLRLRLVDSFNRPGGNFTGVALFANSLWPKCLELLSELVPKAAVLGALLNPGGQDGERERESVLAAAGRIGRQLLVATAGREADIEVAFTSLMTQRVAGLVVSPDSLFTSRRDQIVALAARHTLPTIYQWREYAVAGGLISYGTSLTDAFRQVGVYAGRILKGEKAAELPVMQPTKFELVINLATAKALGLTAPPNVLAIADEVIE